MPGSITEYLHSKVDRARSLARQWKSPSHAGKIMVLVEGWEDKFVYDQFFNDSTAILNHCGGCDYVIGIYTYLNKIAPSIRKVAIIDSDFRYFCGRNKNKSNHFFTDTHDMETMVMFTPSRFQRVINNLRCPSVKHQDIVKDLRVLSYIRWYNQDAKMRYKDSQLDIVHLSQTKISDYDYLMTNHFVPTSGTTKQWLKRCFDRFKLRNARAKAEHLLNGHDYVDRFCYYARVRDKLQLSSDDVLMGIAESCDSSWFKATSLGTALMNWQLKNGIVILV